MGEIADSMIDGELCQECGVYLGEGMGFPRSCAACSNASGIPSQPEKVSCPKCQKRVKAAGLTDHMRARHPET